MLTGALFLLACTADPAAAAGPPADCAAPSRAWRSIATQEDRARLREWRETWIEAIGEARAAGHGDAIDADPVLFDPDAALPDAAPPPGVYDCRTIKIGRQWPEGLAMVAYPRFSCRIGVQDGQPSLVKLTGSQRPSGQLFPDAGRHLVFLGTLQLGDERQSRAYGMDRERDMAGRLERIGEARWRLVLPAPHFESKLDLIELVPAASN